jgi:SAM-dependent methyltransferase
MPSQLAAAMDEATVLVILDPLSFPFEALGKDQWDVPLVLLLPAGFEPGVLDDMFGVPVFERLGFFDRVATGDPELWESLSRKYRWTESQHIELEAKDPADAAVELQARLEEEDSLPTLFGGDRYEALRYWKERGDTLASSSPHRAICSVHHDLGFNKAMHRKQAAALEPQFAAARGGRAEDVPFDVLEVGAGIGRWAASFDPLKDRFTGLDISESMVEVARSNFPEASFDHLGDDLIFPYEDETFDLVFTATVLHHNPTPAKRTLLSEMWRVAKPGGRLMFLEDFVAGAQSENSTVYPMSVLKFVDLVLETTSGQVTLEHVESIRYPHDDVVRGGLISLSKLGIPKKL